MSRQQLYLDNLDLIEQVISFTCRRHRCPVDEAEEFAAVARLALVEDDYAILAGFAGRSKLSTYLTVVVQRLFLEFRIRKWGKWRASADAKRLGPLAVRLEVLLVRDGVSLEESYQKLREADPELAREVVEDLAARLPPRVSRRFEGDAALAALESSDPAPDEQLLAREAAETKRRATLALSKVLAELPPQDQLLLRFRFGEGRQVIEIAGILGLEVRPLYRRLERLAEELRRSLASRGLTGGDFGWPQQPLRSGRRAELVRSAGEVAR